LLERENGTLLFFFLGENSISRLRSSRLFCRIGIRKGMWKIIFSWSSEVDGEGMNRGRRRKRSSSRTKRGRRRRA
jgi:hypothetical protein